MSNIGSDPYPLDPHAHQATQPNMFRSYTAPVANNSEAKKIPHLYTAEFQTPPSGPMKAPELNFALDDTNLPSVDLQSVPMDDMIPPTPDVDAVDKFHQRMKQAIAKTKEANAKVAKMASPENGNGKAKPQKKIVTQTTIHPQHREQLNYGTHTPTDVLTPEDFYDVEDTLPFAEIDAPQLDMTGNSNGSDAHTDHFVMTNGHSNHSNGHAQVNGQANGHAHPQGYAPTPREWHFGWDDTPRHTVHDPRTPARAPPIRDPMLIQTTIQGVAYYADKLDSLHSEYRRHYNEQQALNASLSSLQQMEGSMSPSEYQHRLQSIQNQSASTSQTLQTLIISIYEQFTKMKQSLGTKRELALDHNSRSQFDKFQRYHDQFAQTQHHLLVFGQQAAQKQAQAQQQQQQQAQQQQQLQQQHTQPIMGQQQSAPYYRVPETPHGYRTRVADSYKDYQEHKNNYHSGLPQHAQYATGYNSMTPRDHVSTHNHYAQRKAYPQTATGVPRSFDFSNYNPKQAQQAQQPSHVSRTPRVVNHSAQRPRTQQQQQTPSQQAQKGDIPPMGFVYIGSRMGHLISQIALPDREIAAHQKRIEAALDSVLNKSAHFASQSFDIVSYGSSQHKLFIKDYSDFDLCIRCKSLTGSHGEAIADIVAALGGVKEFEQVRVISTAEESVHGPYLKNTHHIALMDRQSRCGVDIVLNNLPEIGSSRFIAAYESIDPRFALLCRCVKYWARRRRIGDALSGGLSTYAVCLMVVNFLQLRRVLPTLSIMIFDRESGLSPWSTQDDYQINVQKYRDFASKNEEAHSRLLVSFFQFYAQTFDFAKDVVSVRTGTYLTKKEKQWTAHAMAVENPFNSKTNVAQSVTPQCLQRIDAEFKRAYAILCDSHKIYEVCKLAE